MKKILLVLLFPVLLSAQGIPKYIQISSKGTIGPFDDKFEHYHAGLHIACFVGSSVYFFTHRPFLSCVLGTLSTALVGIAKEAIWDKRLGHGTCSNEDAFMTGMGGIGGGMAVRIGIDKNQEKYPDKDLFDNLAPINDSIIKLNPRDL